MKLVTSLFSLLISLGLIALLFWGLTKFVPWFPTLNSFIFYLLTFIFISTSLGLLRVLRRSIGPLKTIAKALGYNGFQIFRIIVVIILLVLGLIYLGREIIANKDLYQGWRTIGLFSFCFFIVLSSLSLLEQFFAPIND